jgi:hypothetical protein
MSSSTNTNGKYSVVVRRVARRGAARREPFVWEIQHDDSAHVLLSSPEPFASMEEAHRSGRSALARLSSAAAREL